MIVLDIETSGLKANKHGIVSIGAIYFDNPKLRFYDECRLDSEDEINKEALKVNGFSEKEIRDENKQSQKELIGKFFEWVDLQPTRMLAGHNVGFFDLNFLKTKAEKYDIKLKTRYRTYDLCSAAQTRHYQIYGVFLLDELKENAMSLSKVLKFCGIEDDRVRVEPEKGIVKKGRSHNALDDVILTAECFSRLLNGKGLFPEYSKFEIPEEIRK